ncbi:MAG: hypothetical protein HGA78_05145 [Nitrospirales bacterium]|nr:hypothetical protein [Nitrospirales bacterium]
MAKAKLCILLVIAAFIPVAGYSADIKPVNVENEGVNTNQKVAVSTIRPVSKKWKDICEYFNGYQQVKYREILDKRNVEQLLGDICVQAQKGDCDVDSIPFREIYNMGMCKEDERFDSLLHEGQGISASLIDVDNDGVKELRFWYYAGTAHCMRNFFWRKDASGQYKFIDAKGYDDLWEDGSGCNAHLIFVPYNNAIYTLYINNFREDTSPGCTPRIRDIWSGSAAELTLICTDREWMIKND